MTLSLPIHRLPALLATLVLLLASLASQAAELRAQVDRQQLTMGEIVELTLESDDPTLFGRPDLAPLQEQFEVLDTRLLTRPADGGAAVGLSTRLVIGLQPRLAGTLRIPPLQIGEARSQAIELQVAEAPPVPAGSAAAPVFLDARLDQERVYVQAQAILTLRVYHSIPLYDDSRLAPLEMTDARVEPLGTQHTYETLIDGVRHGVIEMRYALYPLQSGELKIPPLQFSATSPDGNGSAQPFAPRSGRAVQLSSPELTLQVRPKPASYPAGAPWLPARVLTLSEHWSPQADKVRVGDSLTRSLLLRAEGLASAQLPVLDMQVREQWLRRYPEQPRLSNRDGAHGVIGSREEISALVPTAAGRIELPALDVVWWNTVEDRLMHSRLPARRLEVEDNPVLAVDTPTVLPSTALEDEELLWPWQLACAVLALTTLLGFGLWWRARRQPAVIRAAASGPSPRTLLDDLRRACQSNDPHATRQALDAWARQQPETLADLAARYVPLSDALDGLNGALYSASGHSWQGDELWQAIGSLPVANRSDSTPAPSGSLPPLYPR
ncbi:BatD family protein [Geopseudomonas aromaticivorans]